MRGVPGVFPPQRRGVFRLLLRLLPAGGVYPPYGYIHRKGRLHQRGDRPAAAVCHLCAAGAAGRDRGVLRQLHLRSGRAGRLRPHDDLPAHRHDHGAGRAAAAAGGGSVRAQRRGLPAEHVPGAGRHGGAVPGLLQGQSHPGGVFRRRDRAHHGVPSRHRRGHEAAEPCGGVPRQPLRHAQGQAGAGGGGDRAGAGRAEEVVRGQRQAGGSPAHRPAHPLRCGDDAHAGLLLRHRELFPRHLPAAGGQRAHDAAGLLPGGFRAVRGRESCDAAAGACHVQRRPRPQAESGGLRLPPALCL